MQVVAGRQGETFSRAGGDIEDEPVLVPCAVESSVDVERAPVDLAEQHVGVTDEELPVGEAHRCAAGAATTGLHEHHRVIPVSDAADLRLLAFAEPLAVAVRAVRRSGLVLGQEVAVAGAGPIGLAVAACARLAGAGRVLVAEPVPGRRRLAADLGFETTGALAGDAAEVVFDAAAHPAVAAGLAGAVAVGGRVVLVGVYGAPAPLDLQALTFKEVTVIGTRVYSRDDLRVATAMVADGRFDPSPLITRSVPLTGAASAVDDLRAGRGVKLLVEGAP